MKRRVKYVGPIRPGVEIAATGQFVEFGQSVEVDDDLASALVQQSAWEAVDDTKTKPAPPAKPEATTKDDA